MSNLPLGWTPVHVEPGKGRVNALILHWLKSCFSHGSSLSNIPSRCLDTSCPDRNICTSVFIHLERMPKRIPPAVFDYNRTLSTESLPVLCFLNLSFIFSKTIYSKFTQVLIFEWIHLCAEVWDPSLPQSFSLFLISWINDSLGSCSGTLRLTWGEGE